MVHLFLSVGVSLFTLAAWGKSEEPSHFLMHDFPGGQKVVFRTGGDGLQGIFYVNQDGQAIMIDPRHPFFIGQPDGSREATIKITRNEDLKASFWKIKSFSKLAYAIIGAEILAIKENGLHTRLPLLLPGTGSFSEMNVLDCHTFEDRGREYLYFVYSVNSRPGAMAILIDEDVRLAKKEISTEDVANRSSGILDLKNLLPGAPYPLSEPKGETVSLAFAKGIGAMYRPLKDVTVLDNEGKQVSAIELISKFTTNLTEKFRLHPLTATPVDQDGLGKITEALAGYEITSVAYLGYPGTGKSTDMNLFVSEIANGRGPEFLREYTFIKIEPGALDGQKWRGSTEVKISALKALARANNIVFIVDEVHRLKGKGAHSENPHDITEDLKEEMAEGVLKIIGLSTEVEYYGAGFSQAFLERLVPVYKEEPQGEDLIQLLKGWISSRELTDPGENFLIEARNIAERFAGVGAQPRKTTKLLDAVYARLKLEGREGRKPSIDLLHDVARARLGFDPALIDPKLARQRLENMVRVMDSRIIGQAGARALFEKGTIRALSGLTATPGPRLKILLAGLEGQGKTTMAKAYAEGMGLPYKVIDMSQCRFGQAAGTGPLAQAAAAMASNAFTVLIFDELEKCAIEEQEKLLQAMEFGRTVVQIQTKSGLVSELVDFRNASLIFTTNAGADSLRNKSKSFGFVTVAPQAISRDLLNGGLISRYVLDRVPDVALVESLNRLEFRAAVELHLNALIQQFTRSGLRVNFVDQEKFLNYAASIWREGISNRRITEILRPLEDYLAQESLLNEDFPKDNLVLHFDEMKLSLSGTNSMYSCEDLLQAI